MAREIGIRQRTRPRPRLISLPLLMLGLVLTLCVPFFLYNSLSCQETNRSHESRGTEKVQDVVEYDEGVSACLIVMDDNHFLTEWLAYHYHVANLRHLIITSDPNSLTKPSRVLDRWRDRISIEEWDGPQFLPKKFDSIVKHRTSSAGRSKDSTLQNHRARQAAFNLECLRAFKKKNRDWVLMIDTDEYLVANPNLRNPDFEGFDTSLDLLPMEEPGSISTLLKNMVIPNPRFDEVSTPCVPIHRIQFAARESAKDRVNNLIPLGFNGENFQTLRWRKYGCQGAKYQTKFKEHCGIHRDVPNKVIIDLGRLRLIDLYHEDNSGNPHKPLDSICPGNVYLQQDDTPLVAHHYMGTREQWLYRVGDKRGLGYRLARYEDLNSRIGVKETDRVRPWLNGFVEAVGAQEAARLLNGVGALEEPVPVKQSAASAVSPKPKGGEVYHVGDVVQANYKGDGYWLWAEVGAVLPGGYYNVFYAEDCSEEIATFGARLRRNGTADDSKDYGIDFSKLMA